MNPASTSLSTSSSPAVSPAETNRTRLILILGALIATGPLSIDMYLPAFTQIGREFSASLSKVEWSLAAFFAGLSIGQLFYGVLADRFGRKPPLYFGLVLYVAASVACAFAASLEQLVAARFLQALGGCAGMVVTRAMVRDLFDHRETARVFSLLMLVMGVAPILAPLAGGTLIRFADWRAIFAFLSIFGSLCFFAILIWLPETRRADPTVRLSRAVPSYLAVLRDREFLWNTLAGGLAQAGMFAYITGSPFVLIELYGVAPENYGWFFGLNAIGIIGSSQLNAWWVGRASPTRVMQRAIRVMVAAALVLFAASLVGGALWTILAPLFVYASTLGLIFPNSTANALSRQGARAGVASALIGTLQFVLASAAAMTVSALHAENALPMSATILICASLSALAAWRASCLPVE